MLAGAVSLVLAGAVSLVLAGAVSLVLAGAVSLVLAGAVSLVLADAVSLALAGAALSGSIPGLQWAPYSEPFFLVDPHYIFMIFCFIIVYSFSLMSMLITMQL